MRRVGLILSAILVVSEPSTSSAALSRGGGLTFEDLVRLSDRIVVATMLGESGEMAWLPVGQETHLGIKDAATGLVFTPYRVRVRECLLASDASCREGDAEVLIPGGTVYELIDGRPRLRTWEVSGAAGAVLPPIGENVLLFLRRRSDRYVPINDPGGRSVVRCEAGAESVTLEFASTRLLSPAGLAAVGAGSVPGSGSGRFVETIDLRLVKSLIEGVRRPPFPGR